MLQPPEGTVVGRRGGGVVVPLCEPKDGCMLEGGGGGSSRHGEADPVVMVSGGARVGGEVTTGGQRAAGLMSLPARACVRPTHAGIVPS